MRMRFLHPSELKDRRRLGIRLPISGYRDFPKVSAAIHQKSMARYISVNPRLHAIKTTQIKWIDQRHVQYLFHAGPKHIIQLMKGTETFV